MKKYDVAIVGGGLAGLTLAIQLAKSSRKVILFEKKTYPFHKVCGEYISMESWDFLLRCGLPLNTLNLPRITELLVSSPNGNYFKHNLNPGGFGVSRYTLDKALADIAINEEVELHTNTKVFAIKYENETHYLTTANEVFAATIVAGTFGKHSNLDQVFEKKKNSPKNNYVGIKYHVKANLPDNRIELHNFEDGYCGISKVDNERYCLCYLTNAMNLQKMGNNIQQMEDKILMKNPFLKKYFSEFTKLYDEPLVISQISFSQKKIIQDHVLMCGDAAGMITPLCGNGMSMAMNASAIAAVLIDSFLDNRISRMEMERLYQKLWNKSFSFRLSAGRKIQSLFGKSYLTNKTIGTLKHFPGLVNSLIRLTHGKKF